MKCTSVSLRSPTPKFPDARPTLLIFRLIFPRLIFPRFSLAMQAAYELLNRISRVDRWATLPESSRSSPHLASRARKSMKSLCSFRMRSTSTMLRCEKEVFTRGKLDALESHGQRLFANRKTQTFTGSLSKENIALEKWNRLWQVRQLIIFSFGILFLFSFSDT